IPGWLFPHQNHAFPGQLEDGVRALLIDVHYGVPAEEHVITDFSREGGTSIDKIKGPLGPEATEAAVRIRNRFLGHETGKSALYFCHGFASIQSRLPSSAGRTVQAPRSPNPPHKPSATLPAS